MSCCAPSSPPASPVAAVPAALVHLHLHVPRLDAAVTFYRRFLGADPVKQKAGYAKFLPAWAPLNLALSERPDVGGSAAVSHLGIQVASRDELRRQLDRVRAAGLEPRVELGVDCCHANQDKFWVAAPGGIAWEVYHLNHDLAGEDAACATRGATDGCCA